MRTLIQSSYSVGGPNRLVKVQGLIRPFERVVIHPYERFAGANIPNDFFKPAHSLQFPAEAVMGNDLDAAGNLLPNRLWKMVDIAGAMVGFHTVPSIPLATVGIESFKLIQQPPLHSYLRSHAALTGMSKRSLDVKVFLDADYVNTDGKLAALPIAEGWVSFAVTPKHKGQLPERKINSPEVFIQQQIQKIRSMLRKEEQLRINALLNGNPDLLRISPAEIHNSHQVRITTQQRDKNRINTVFGGLILQLMHQASEKVAKHYAKNPVKLMMLDKMRFEKPGLVGDTLVACPKVLGQLDERQFEVQVDLYAYRPKVSSQTVPFRLLNWLSRLHLNRWLPLQWARHKDRLPIASGYFIYEPAQPEIRLKPPQIKRTQGDSLDCKRFQTMAFRMASRDMAQEAINRVVQPDP